MKWYTWNGSVELETGLYWGVLLECLVIMFIYSDVNDQCYTFNSIHFLHESNPQEKMTQNDRESTVLWLLKVNSLSLEDEIAKSFEQYLGYEDSELEKINKIIFDFISEHNQVKLKNGKKFEVDQKEILAARSANFQGMDEIYFIDWKLNRLWLRNRGYDFEKAHCTRVNDMYIDYVTPHSCPFPSHKTI